MSSYCSSPSCLNGNCPGCKKGSKYCNDPRCYPDCPDCSGETNLECLGGRNGWDWTLIIIIGILALLVLILFIVMSRQRNYVPSRPSQPSQVYQPVGYQTVGNQPAMYQPQVQVTTQPVGQ